MKNRDEARLNEAIAAVRADEPNIESLSASADRIACRLGVLNTRDLLAGAIIENCEDVRHLMPAYRAGTLSSARKLLVDAHLHDCGPCLRHFRAGEQGVSLDWSIPKIAPSNRRSRRVFEWSLAFSFALLVCAAFLYRAYWQVPPGVRAQVQSIDGSAYLISASGDRQLSPGSVLREGDQLRTAGASRVILRLADGSTIETNERSVLRLGARGHSMTVSLDDGAIIVEAAKRTSGHLYVRTPDCRVAVTGTVFSVSSGLKGSRVAVLQGDVQVVHAGIHSLLHGGDQITTNDNLNPEPLERQVAWSQDSGRYLGLLAQFATLQHRIGQIPFPEPRYGSDLLPRVPAGTLIYMTIPNLGEFLNEANVIFHDQLNKSPELQQWWSRGGSRNATELDTLVQKVREVSQYLGNEVVVVGAGAANSPSFAVIADVEKSGLDDLLKTEFTSANNGLTVLDRASLNSTSAPAKMHSGVYALVRPHEVVFSGDLATLKTLNAQLNAGPSGFANTEFGKQIAAAYERGAGIVLAADLHKMLSGAPSLVRGKQPQSAGIENSGIGDVQYLIAEHRERNGSPENHLNVQFSGARQRVASWLAAPAPIGSLDFVTPNASLVVAGLSKQPKDIADDIMALTSQRNAAKQDLNQADAQLQISVREDIAANLGGDFLLALDGPVLPSPSWKAVIEIHDADRLERTLETLVQAINHHTGGQPRALAIEPGETGTQRYYALRNLTSGVVVAQYTFSNGYMIIAPNRALLIEAMQTRASGNSLSHSAAFRALLPKDAHVNYSAVAYQNLNPVLTPLLSQLGGDSADAIRTLAADSKPTVICAWGEEQRIEAASDSRLFGFDFLTLETLINSRNNMTGKGVRN